MNQDTLTKRILGTQPVMIILISTCLMLGILALALNLVLLAIGVVGMVLGRILNALQSLKAKLK